MERKKEIELVFKESGFFVKYILVKKTRYEVKSLR